MPQLKFISLDQLLEKRANQDKFKLVDVLPPESFNEGHIPGAVNLPLDKLSDSAGRQLDKNETIIVYCASYHCQASTEAARTLLKMGYKDVLDFKAGKASWQKAGLELEK